MEGHLEALLEMDFCTKPPNFGVEAHMEAPAGDALRQLAIHHRTTSSTSKRVLFNLACKYRRDAVDSFIRGEF
jgi:hypothetical protein